jgi:hypothetical protein
VSARRQAREPKQARVAADQTANVHVLDWEAAPPFGRRDNFLWTLRQLLRLRPRGACIVETGTLRSDAHRDGDGWSTVAWGWYCLGTGGRVFTVDIDAGAIEVCRRMTAPYSQVIEYVTRDSVEFLREWRVRDRGEIDLVYLDSLDYFGHLQEKSEAHHLAEAEAALPHLSAACLILIDDTSLAGASPEEGFRGKGARAVPYLLERGFRLEWAEGGQVLLSRGVAESAVCPPGGEE